MFAIFYKQAGQVGDSECVTIVRLEALWATVRSLAKEGHTDFFFECRGGISSNEDIIAVANVLHLISAVNSGSIFVDDEGGSLHFTTTGMYKGSLQTVKHVFGGEANIADVEHCLGSIHEDDPDGLALFSSYGGTDG